MSTTGCSAVAQRATQVWWADLLPDLMASFDQIDAALRHCLDHDTDPSRAQMLYMILWGAVHQARVDDVLALGELVMRRWPDTGPGAATDVVATYAMGKLLCGHAEEAEALAERALPNAAGSWAAATGLRRVLALAARYRGDHEQAAALLEEAADAAARNGAVTFDLECRTYRAQDLAAMGHTEEALGIVEAIAADAARRGSILNEIWARTVQASVLATAATPALDQARQVATDALSASERIAYPFGVSCNIQTIALCHLASGAISEAAASAERLLDAFARSGSRRLSPRPGCGRRRPARRRPPIRRRPRRHGPPPARHQPDGGPPRAAAAQRGSDHPRPVDSDRSRACRPGRRAV